MRRFLKIIGIVALASALLAISFISYDYFRTREAFPPKTFITTINVSGLTKSEAIAELKSYPLSELFTPLITLEADGSLFAFSPDELGIYVLYEETVKNAFEITHKDNYIEELKERITEGEIFAPLVISINEAQLRAVMETLANKIRTSPKDASIILYEKTASYNIEAEVVGREADIGKSIAVFKNGLYRGEKIMPIVIDYTYPKITEKALREHPPVNLLSAYTTYYGRHDSRNRIHNIKLIASWINDTLLMPGDVFSLEEIVGEYTPERGFKEAFVIYGGELVPQFGGGTCQIGTTLYNATSLADLNVLERRNHSFYFNIYPLGRDATVYPEQADFRFENDSGYPILIKARATNQRLSFKIYGTASGKKVRFSSVKLLGRDESGKYVPMSLKEVIELDVPFKTSITRTVYDRNWKVVKRETVRSFYKLYGEKENVPIRRPEPR